MNGQKIRLDEETPVSAVSDPAARKALRDIERAIQRGANVYQVDRLRDKAEAFFDARSLADWVVYREWERDDMGGLQPATEDDSDSTLNPLDVDESLLGVCVVCQEHSSKGLCQACRLKYTDQETGEKPEWLADMLRERNRHTQAYHRNQKRLAAGQTHSQRTGKRGRPKAVGVEKAPLSDLDNR